MTYVYKLANFKTQLNNTLNNIFHPDVKAAAIVKNFIFLPNPTVNDFNNLVTLLQNVAYTSLKTQATFSPVINALVAQQDYLMLQNITKVDTTTIVAAVAPSLDAAAVHTSGIAVMQCTPTGTGQYTLTPITKIPTTFVEAYNAQNACMEYSQTSGDHYLTTTGNVAGCTGSYDAIHAYYVCISGI